MLAASIENLVNVVANSFEPYCTKLGIVASSLLTQFRYFLLLFDLKAANLGSVILFSFSFSFFLALSLCFFLWSFATSLVFGFYLYMLFSYLKGCKIFKIRLFVWF